MQTTWTGEVNEDTMETIQKALMVFFGKNVKIVIEESNGEKRPRNPKPLA